MNFVVAVGLCLAMLNVEAVSTLVQPMPAGEHLFPFQLTQEIHAKGVADLVKAVIQESDLQVSQKADVRTKEAGAEFRMACDALNCWRMRLRFIEETQEDPPSEGTELSFRDLTTAVAKTRKYDIDDFYSALVATQQRTRLPWGYTSLQLAHGRASRNPIRLLKGDLRDARVPAAILGIALELSKMNERPSDSIFIPVDSLQSMLGIRKLVVSGAIQRLIAAGLLELTSKKYGTGRAREFRIRAKCGDDYEYENTPSADAGAGG